MANKKRRGRPPGSKNKVTSTKHNVSVGKMDIRQLSEYIAGLRDTLAAKVEQQRAYLESQLAALREDASAKSASVKRTVLRAPRTAKRAKPKYQSKKDKSLKWTGRGMRPTWMREEMKGTELKKDDFLIK